MRLETRPEREHPSIVPALRDLIAAVASWDRPPDHWSGRTAVVVLDGPVETALGAVRALRVKGLGLGPSAGRPAAPPSPTVYRKRPEAPEPLHLGPTSAGDFELVPGRPAPVGGLVLEAAVNEFDVCAAVRAAGCPAPQPLAVRSMPSLRFEGQPMAVVVTGLPDAWCVRGAALLDDLQDVPPDARDALCGAYGDGLPAAAAFARDAGRAVRSFVEAGHYRYSSHFNNFLFSAALGGPLMMDFDTCRDAARLGPVERPLQAVRDAMSGLWNAACNLVAPTRLARTLERLGPGPCDPLGGFLGGFFADVDVAPSETEGLVGCTRHAAARLLACRPADDDWNALQALRLDQPVFCAAAYLVCFRAYARSALQRRWPLPYDESELRLRLTRFLGGHGLARVDGLAG